MTRRPSRVSRWLKLFGKQAGMGSRRKQRKSEFAVPESLEARIVLSAKYVTNHVLLSIEQTDAEKAVNVAERIDGAYPGATIEPLGDYGIYLVTLPSGVNALSAITHLRKYDGVKTAEPDWIGEWSAVPNDPDFGEMWGHQNTGQTVNGVTGIPDADIDSDSAWDLTTGSTSAIVAIVDSGMDYLHPDLAANVWVNPGEIAGNGVDDDGNGYIDDINGYDFADDDADPMDFVGHGTHVSGTVGAVGNNGIGTVGVNWTTSMMALKIGSDFGGPTNSGAIAAINYAVAMGAVVSNHSYTVNPTQALQDAITNAQANGHIVVVAAGNSASNNDFSPTFPASYTQDNVVTVAATDQNDDLAFFSNFGVTSVDIGAPGVNIWSTTPRAGSLFYGPNYDFSDGTSMAAPAVAGAIAFLRGIAPNLSYLEIIDALYQGADQLPSLAGVVSTGGRLNLDKSAQLLQPASISISPAIVAETAGTSGSFITIRKDAFPVGSALVLNLAFDDPSEVNVPALAGGSTITIPAGSRQIVLPIDILDDTLLDGTQTVTFTLSIGGTLIDQDIIQVTDVETISISVNPSAVREDAGPGAGTVTVTRSNTDTAPPNTFSVANNRLHEHDPSGALVRTRTIPWPTGSRPASQIARDLVVMEDGRIAVYNGTTNAYLSIFNRVTNQWQHIPVPALSTESSDLGTGGISSIGNYIFLSDTQSTASDEFGVVRVDLTTGQTVRFATQSPGYRMFVKDIFTDGIIEVDPDTGVTLNTIPMPVTPANNFGFNNGLAFDGTNLWVLAGPIGNDKIYKVNPDTGDILEVHSLGGTQGWDGLGWLNGLLYAQDDFIDNRITVYDPVLRRVVDTLDVGTLNNINISGGLTGITGPDRLLATSTFGDTVYEINPSTGMVTSEWTSGFSSAEGLATANGEIYLGAFQQGSLQVFNRNGVFQRSVDVTLSRPEGVHALGGDNILTMVETDFRYRDVYAGLDDKVYVLDLAGTVAGRYDANTLELEEFFTLSRPVEALAVDATGTLWGVSATGYLYKFRANGSLIAQKKISSDPLIDIDLNVTGQILASTSTGRVFRTSTSFAASTNFRVGTTPAFASLGRHQSQPGGDLLVDLTSSDTTEATVQNQIVIPVGQRTVTVPLDAVDDNVLDGNQTVTITAFAPGYSGAVSDTIEVRDAERLGVDIIADSISEAAGPAATMARVYRTDTEGPFTYVSTQNYSNNTQQTILDNDKINSYITVPTQTSQLTDVNVTLNLTHSFLADLDIYLVSPNGTRVELVTDLLSNEPLLTGTIFDDQARGSILTGSSPYTGRFRPEGSLLSLNDENPAGVWTLEITDDNRTDFGTLFSWSLNIQTIGLAARTVTLTTYGNPGEISVQRTVTIPANQSEVFVPVNALDDNLLDGTQIAGIKTSSSSTQYVFGNDKVNVTDLETLLFTVSGSSVSEASGRGALTGRLTRQNDDISSPFTVSLFSSDTTELKVQSTVTIPAGQRSVTFPIDAVDDSILDGTRNVTIRASAPAYGADKTVQIAVEDLEASLLVTGESTAVREDAGRFFVTVTRLDQTNISGSMRVALAVVNVSGGAAPFTVPPFVTIPANSRSTTFSVTVNDDNLLDGTQTASIQATATGVTTGTTAFDVTDYETVTVSTDRSTIREDEGRVATRGTVTRSNTDTGSPLVVTLTSSDLTELTVPTTVTIPAGARSARFDINAVNDPALDGTQRVTISASAANYFGGTSRVNVADHEPPVLTTPAASVTSSRPVIKWLAVPEALRYDVLLKNLSTGVEQLYPSIPASPSPEFTRQEPLGIGRYQVLVRAVDQLERPGYWSVARNFKVVTAPVIQTPVATGTTANAVFPEISWSAVIDAAGYQLFVSNKTTGKNGVISEKALRTTSYRAESSFDSGVYEAMVRAYNSKNEFGEWSVVRSFTVLAAPSVVTPVTGGTFDRSPTLRWTTVSGATTYDVLLTNLTTDRLAFRNRSVPGDSIRIPRDLPDGDYQLVVRAQSGQSFSSWSTPLVFSIGAPPTITSPTSGQVAGGRPKFVWTGISGAERYELQVLDKDSGKFVLQQTSITSTSFTAPTALPLGSYSVTVRAVSTLGEITEWSEAVDFLGGSLPTINQPITGSTPVITWSGVAGASSYVLQVRDLTTNALVLSAQNILTNEYSVTSALASGRYRVWVRAVSSSGVLSRWSEPVSFTVASNSQHETAPQSDAGTLLASALAPVLEASAEKHDDVALTITPAEEQLPEAGSELVIATSDASETVYDAVMASWDASDWWNVEV